jgi:hypothetical protein
MIVAQRQPILFWPRAGQATMNVAKKFFKVFKVSRIRFLEAAKVSDDASGGIRVAICISCAQEAYGDACLTDSLWQSRGHRFS